MTLPDMRQYVDGWPPEAVRALQDAMMWTAVHWDVLQRHVLLPLLWAFLAALIVGGWAAWKTVRDEAH